MPRRKDYTAQIAAAWARVATNCGCDDLYYCPTADDIECPRHSGFATCCNRPRRHAPVTSQPQANPNPFAVPNINTDNLDLDDFHPLDHPLDHTLAQCTGYPGGRQRHLAYQWVFQTEPRLHAATLCRIGYHKPTLVKGRDNTDPRTDTDQWYVWDGCLHCHKPLSARQPL